MQVAQYTFQSPSPSPVQVGRLDPSSVQKEQDSTPKKQKSANLSAASSKSPEQWLKSDAVEVQNIKPTIKASIDIYA